MTWKDEDCNVIAVCQYLRLRYPVIYKEMLQFLLKHGVQIIEIKHTANIWARDYMPIQVNNHWIKFKYKNYEDFPLWKVDPMAYEFLKPLGTSRLLLDGGNIVRRGNMALVTEMFLKDNAAVGEIEATGLLSKMLDCEIVFIPVEPEDTLGHSDGIVKFIDDNTVLINDYAAMGTVEHLNYQKALIAALEKHGIKTEIMPFLYHKRPDYSEENFRKLFPFADDFNPGYGYFINFLIVKDCILVPKFYIGRDQEIREKNQQAALTVKRFYPGYHILQIECSSLSMEGGLLNCITMGYKL